MSTVDTEGRQDYLFDTASDLGQEQMELLSVMLDATTTESLGEVGVGPGWNCLDVGAGGGSVARWLAERVAPDGSVVATDIATDNLPESPGVRVMRHDINNGVPPAGPFDLIHARLVLLHLPNREEIFARLVDSLAPGGWIVLAEYGTRLSYALAAPTSADMELFDRVQQIGHREVGPAAGQSLLWAHEMYGHMRAAGLINMGSREFSRTTVGGDAGSRYHRNLIAQVHQPMVRVGATEAELERYRELLLAPEFHAWFYQFITTWGQKPAV